MASPGLLRSLGAKHQLPKVMALLAKDTKRPTTEEMNALIEDEGVLYGLKKVEKLSDRTLEDVKAIFVLGRRYDPEVFSGAALEDVIDNFVDNDNRELLAGEIVEADKTDEAWEEQLDNILLILGLLDQHDQDDQGQEDDQDVDVPPPTQAQKKDNSADIAAVAAAAATAAVAALGAQKPETKAAPEPKPKTKSEISMTSAPAATAPIQIKSKITPKANPKPTVSEATSSSSTPALTASLTPSLTLETAKSISNGFRVNLATGELNFTKYTDTFLDAEFNRSAKLLVIDIDSCKDTMYPAAVDLAPGSTNRHVLGYVVKVLAQALSKGLRCHTSLHVYTVSGFTNTERVTYLSLTK
jgi:hypothetical protein